MRWTLACLVGTRLMATSARAGIWIPEPDGEVVLRADVIVIARIVPGTIDYILHEATNRVQGRSWEHHVTIAVSRTVEGELAAGEHRVLVRYGLTPCVGGQWKQDGGEIHLPGRGPDVIELVGDLLDVGFPDTPDDLRDDHVWLLRRGTSRGPGAERKEMLEIVDTQDIQLASRLGYLRLYLADDPEAAVRKHVQEHPEDAVRVLPYLQHRAVQRATSDPDPSRRVERLLPFFCAYVLYGWRDEAGEAIEAAGEVAVPWLIALLDDSGLYESRRTEVILKLGRIGSRRAVPALVAILEKNTSLLQGVAKAAAADREALARPVVSRRLHEMASAIFSLGLIGDAAATEVIRGTENEWKVVLPADHPVLEWCRFALERFSR